MTVVSVGLSRTRPRRCCSISRLRWLSPAAVRGGPTRRRSLVAGTTWRPGAACENHPEAVLAFADHYIMNRRGDIDLARSHEATAIAGRSDLAAGFHQPFFDMASQQTISLLACVFQAGGAGAFRIASSVGTACDVWIPYMLASTGGAAYFEPRRLMYYREHGGSETAVGDLSGCFGHIECWSRMLRDPRLHRSRGRVLRSRLARSHEVAGARLLRQGRRRQARAELQAAMRVRLTAKSLCGWAASWVAPTSVLPSSETPGTMAPKRRCGGPRLVTLVVESAFGPSLTALRISQTHH